MLDENAELERELADPAVHGDAARARTLGRRYAQLGPIVAAYREWLTLGDDVEAARELGVDDASFAAEADRLAGDREVVAERLRRAPRASRPR